MICACYFWLLEYQNKVTSMALRLSASIASRIHIVIFSVMTPLSGKWVPTFQRNYCLHLQDRSDILEMEPLYSSERW
jgi:hypothetical protein